MVLFLWVARSPWLPWQLSKPQLYRLQTEIKGGSHLNRVLPNDWHPPIMRLQKGPQSSSWGQRWDWARDEKGQKEHGRGNSQSSPTLRLARSLLRSVLTSDFTDWAFIECFRWSLYLSLARFLKELTLIIDYERLREKKWNMCPFEMQITRRKVIKIATAFVKFRELRPCSSEPHRTPCARSVDSMEGSDEMSERHR